MTTMGKSNAFASCKGNLFYINAYKKLKCTWPLVASVELVINWMHLSSLTCRVPGTEDQGWASCPWQSWWLAERQIDSGHPIVRSAHDVHVDFFDDDEAIVATSRIFIFLWSSSSISSTPMSIDSLDNWSCLIWMTSSSIEVNSAHGVMEVWLHTPPRDQNL